RRHNQRKIQPDITPVLRSRSPRPLLAPRIQRLGHGIEDGVIETTVVRVPALAVPVDSAELNRLPGPDVRVKDLVEAQVIEGWEQSIRASASIQVFLHLVFVGEDELLGLAP